jgi:Tfp pilus assembly protein PilV
MRGIKKNQKGVTLMELLVYLGISALVILAMGTFMVNVTKARVLSNNQRLAQQNARLILEKMTYSLRNAYDVNVLSPAKVEIKSYDYNDPNNPVSKTAVIERQADNLLYLDGWSLTEEGVSVTNVNFEKVSSSLQVSLTTEKNSQQASLSSTISFRQL